MFALHVRPLAAVLLLLATPHPGSANLLLDGSLGNGVQPVGPDYVIAPEQGQTLGSNLLHSFAQFDIDPGESATFVGPPSIENVVGRVTGSDRSEIFGPVRSTIPGANLFLLNPLGFLFGPGASIEVSGSFHASSARDLVFTTGEVFEARPGGAVPLLDVARPAAFGFLAAAPGSIDVDLTLLSVPEGETLSLIGGAVTLTGDATTDDPTVSAPGGTVNLVAVASPGVLDLVDPTPGPEFAALADVDIQTGFVDTSSSGSGTIRIRGERLVMNNGFLFSDGLGLADGAPLAVDVEARDSISATGGIIESFALGGGVLPPGADRSTGDVRLAAPEISLDGTLVAVGSTGPVAGGTLEIEADSIALHNGAELRSVNEGLKRGSDIVLDADSIVLDSDAFIDTVTRSAERGGDVIVSAGVAGGCPDPPCLRVLDSAQLITSTRGLGRGGDVDVEAHSVLVRRSDAPDAATLIGTFSFDTDPSADPALGRGGDLHLHGGSVAVENGGQLITATDGGFRAGDLTIDDASDVTVTGSVEPAGAAPVTSGLFAQVGRPGGGGASGTGGDLTVRATRILVEDGGQVVAGSDLDSPGDLGSILLEAESIAIVGGGERGTRVTVVTRNAQAGGIRLLADRLSILDGAQVTASSVGTGTTGGIHVEAREIRVAGKDQIGPGQPAGIFAQTRFVEFAGSGPAAPAGNIRILTESLSVSDSGQISVSSSGTGPGGAILINVPDPAAPPSELDLGGAQVSVARGGQIRSDSRIAGDAGDVTIRALNLLLSDGASVSALSDGTGVGGDVDVRLGSTFSARSGSRISARAENSADPAAAAPDGGNINIVAGVLVELIDSELDAFAQGNGGNVTIDPTSVVVNSSDVSARARFGAGGAIAITTDFYFESADSVVSASSEFGVAGTVEIRSPDFDLVGDLAALSDSYLEPVAVERDRCSARGPATTGSFVVTGRDGLPPSPDGPLPAFVAPEQIPRSPRVAGVQVAAPHAGLPELAWSCGPRSASW